MQIFKPFTKNELQNAIHKYVYQNDQSYGHISTWDTSLIIDMSKLFYDMRRFNEPINNWNVSNVTNMSSMFYNCTTFNQSLDNWDVSNVTNMSSMFYNCTAFNQSLNNWDVSNVTNMSSMFYNCTAFNQSLNNWDVSNVLYMDNIFTNTNAIIDKWKVNININLPEIYGTNDYITGRIYPTYKYTALNSGWRFSDNILGYKYTPDYLYNNNKWLIHYETYLFRDYPIITLPQGTMLYTYARNNVNSDVNFAYNTYKTVNINHSLKFFFPIPYLAPGLFDNFSYKKCNIVCLHKSVRMLGLCLPSPVSSDILKLEGYGVVKNNIDYYENELIKKKNLDLDINPQMMIDLNLQGYINIQYADSMTQIKINMIHGKHILNQLIFKSCLTATKPNYDDDSDNDKIEFTTLPPSENAFINEFKQKVNFSIPEIALSPFNSASVMADPNMTIDFLAQQVAENNIEPYFNYKLLQTVPNDYVKDYLDSIADHIVENTQCPIMHIYTPFANMAEFPYIRPVTLYSDYTLDDVNWLRSYTHPEMITTTNNVCAFDTVIYHKLLADNTSDKMQIGGKRGKRVATTRKRKRRRTTIKRRRTTTKHRRTCESKSVFTRLCPFGHNFEGSDRERYRLRENEHKGGQTITTSTFTTQPLLKSHLPSYKPKAIINTVNVPKRITIAKKTWVAQMTKNNIPILYWK